MRLRNFVAGLTEDQCRQVHEDYTILERKGVIGDCTLRDLVDQFILQHGLGATVPIIWMDKMAAEVWRRFTVELQVYEIARLQAALKPFADAAMFWEAFHPEEELVEPWPQMPEGGTGDLKVKHLREAGRVLYGPEEK